MSSPIRPEPEWQSDDPSKPNYRPRSAAQSIDPSLPNYVPATGVPRVVADASSVNTSPSPGFVSPSEAARLAEDQLTFGLGKRANAAIRSLFEGGSYKANVADEQAKLDAASKKYGAFGSEVAGNIPWLFGGEVLKALGLGSKAVKGAKAATVLGDAIDAAKTGAKFGAAAGAGHSDVLTGSDASAGQQVLDLLRGTGEGALAGGAFGGAVGAAGGKIAKGSQNILDRTSAARASNVPLSVGQTINSPVVKGLEAAVSVLPTARGVMARFGQNQAAKAGAEAERLAAQMAGRSAITPADLTAFDNRSLPVAVKDQSGRVWTGKDFGLPATNADGTAHTDLFAKAKAQGATFTPQEIADRGWVTPNGRFGNVSDFSDALVQHDLGTLPTPKVPADAEAAGKLVQSRAKQVLDQWRAEIPKRQAAVADAITAANPRGTVVPTEFRAAAKAVIDAANDPKNPLASSASPAAERAAAVLESAKANGGVLNASDLLALRTELNELAYKGLDGATRTSGQTRRFQDLVQGLDHDIERTVATAEQTHPGAQAAWDDYNAHVSTARSGGGGRRGSESKVDLLEHILDQSPGEAYRTVTHAPDNAGAVTRMRDILGNDVMDPVAARHFLDLGRANPGAQDAAGQVFSPETFMSRWNAKGFTPDVRNALYGDASPLHDFANTMSEIKSSAPYRNTSGTAGAMQGAQFAKDALLGGAQMGLVENSTHNPMITAATLAGPPVAASALTAPLAPWLIRQGAKVASPSRTRTLIDMLAELGGNLIGSRTGNQQ